jgi:hypothetical protein
MERLWSLAGATSGSQPAAALRHVTGSPVSDYYGGSVPSQRHQPTAGLPTADLAGRRGGRPWEGSRVHHAPVGGGGAQLLPCSLATGTPQTFPVAFGPADATPTAKSRINR